MDVDWLIEGNVIFPLKIYNIERGQAVKQITIIESLTTDSSSAKKTKVKQHKT